MEDHEKYCTQIMVKCANQETILLPAMAIQQSHGFLDTQRRKSLKSINSKVSGAQLVESEMASIM